MRIDSHQHFWKYKPQTYNWIDERMQKIRMDYMPADLEPLLHKHRMDGTVAVQALALESDTDFLLDLANTNPCVKKVVGWVDVRAADLSKKIEQWDGQKKLAGFRHISQSEPPKQLYDPHLKKGLGLLFEKGYTYDVLVFPEHLQGVYDLTRNFPEQKFVLNHLAKPRIKNREMESWKKDIQRLGKFPNFYCKVSGMVTEADWDGWKQEDFKPYMDVVLETFGPNRIMYGSDWPVALVAASYTQVIDIVESYIDKLTQSEQQKIMGGASAEFYGIDMHDD